MIKAILRALGEKEDLLLRIAVAFPLIWAGVRQIMNPFDWIGFVPPWLSVIIPSEIFLTVHSIFNLVIGVGLLVGFWRIVFSGLAFVSLASIVIFYGGGVFLGIDDVTFRDVGLAIVALVLFLRAIKTRSMLGHPMS